MAKGPPSSSGSISHLSIPNAPNFLHIPLTLVRGILFVILLLHKQHNSSKILPTSTIHGGTLSSERMKNRAQKKILEILGSCQGEDCHNRTLTGRLESMGITRRIYKPALDSLVASDKIIKVPAGDTHFWRLAEQPVAVS